MSEHDHEQFQQKITNSPFAHLMGFELVEKERGRVVLRLPFAEQLRQALGRMHGGAIFALADHASGWATFTTLRPGERCATLEMKINYIGAVHDEDCIVEARVIHSGRTSAVVESEVRTDSGRLVARTLATFMVLKQKPDEEARVDA
ncbi:MAG TPA: PaaI family thioesterase [Blastocatellia bacterium]|nr:PaaI family thioesterase [Blastocatellia bacterium]